jgi:DNA-binding transcriptional regulator YiaG
MAIRYQPVPGPRGVNRLARASPGRSPGGAPVHRPSPLVAALDGELEALREEAATTAQTARDLQRRIRRLVTDARRNMTRRRAMSPRASRESLALPDISSRQLLGARTAASLSQRDLAARLGIHRSSVAEAERGRRQPHPAHAQWAAGMAPARKGEQP